MDLSGIFDLTGKTALVTGGSRSLGKWMAEGLTAQGAKVYVTSRNAEQCEETAAELGPMCHALPEDISTLAGIKAAVGALEARESELHILVNNAGATWGHPFADFPEKGWDKVMDLNLKSPFFLTQMLYPLLKAGAKPDRPAKVINIASIDSFRLNEWETYSYHASKAGLVQLTRRLAARLVSDSIVVNAIAPGAFPSDMNQAASLRGESVGRAIPAGRVGSAEDIAAAVIYLASRAGDYVVGDTLSLDGGLVHAELGASIAG